MFEAERKTLLDTLKLQGIHDSAVLKAINEVPREAFLPTSLHHQAYDNCALPIDCDQTISQPYIVALMTQALISQGKTNKVLEIGTGSGYQTAILAKLYKQVYTIERVQSLHEVSKQVLQALKFQNIQFLFADGYEGWKDQGPFDGIIVTAAPATMPFNLVAQLNDDHGVLVVPIGEQEQVLKQIIKVGERYFDNTIEHVRFVPMIKGTTK